jgi:hypothetical protein
MQQTKIIYLLSFIGMFTQSVFSQLTTVQKIDQARNIIDYESQFCGDTIIVRQTIEQIEGAINNYDIDEILFITASSRVKKGNHKNLEKEKFSDSKKTLDSLYFNTCKNLSGSSNEFDSLYYLQENQDHFQISNIKLFEENDSIIIVSLDLKFKANSYFFPIEKHYKKVSNSIENTKGNPKTEENKYVDLIHDTWVFEKKFGQWKLKSCDQLLAALNNINQKVKY